MNGLCDKRERERELGATFEAIDRVRLCRELPCEEETRGKLLLKTLIKFLGGGRVRERVTIGTSLGFSLTFRKVSQTQLNQSSCNQSHCVVKMSTLQAAKDE